MHIAIETSTRHSSVALAGPHGIIEQIIGPELDHARNLAPALSELLSLAECEAQDIEAVFVGLGPGSYTGLRVGIATGLGLARGTSATIRGVPSGEFLLWRELEMGQSGVHLCDARAGRFYFARFRREEQGMHALRAPCLLTAEEVRAELADDNGPILTEATVLEGAALNAECAQRARSGAYPQAAALLELAAAAPGGDCATWDAPLEPLYLREFEAKPRRR